MQSQSQTIPSPTLDALPPAQIAVKARDVGVAKAKLGLWKTFALAVLAGLFIGMGAEFFTLVTTGVNLGFGLTKLLGGIVFSLGLILVVVAGAELFTGNNLLTVAWLGRAVPFRMVMRNWGIVFVGNLVGSLLLAWLIYVGTQWEGTYSAFGVTALSIAASKASIPIWTGLVRGILCNFLVCLAVWLCFSGRTVADKILAILFPITGFVASGFEHSVANMYFIPLGLLLKGQPAVVASAQLSEAALGGLTVLGFLRNLIPVTIGNLIGGGVLVGVVYWFCYMREEKKAEATAGSSPVRHLRLLDPLESDSMIDKESLNAAAPVARYSIASADMYYSQANDRLIYMKSEANKTISIWGEIEGLGKAAAANLDQILLEYGMTCKAQGELSQAYRLMDEFGQQMGQALASRIIQATPARSDANRCYFALECVLGSMNVQFSLQQSGYELQLTVSDCSICEGAGQYGLSQWHLAHHGLKALCQSVIYGVSPNTDLRFDMDTKSEHTLYLPMPATLARAV